MANVKFPHPGEDLRALPFGGRRGGGDGVRRSPGDVAGDLGAALLGSRGRAGLVYLGEGGCGDGGVGGAGGGSLVGGGRRGSFASMALAVAAAAAVVLAAAAAAGAAGAREGVGRRQGAARRLSEPALWRGLAREGARALPHRSKVAGGRGGTADAQIHPIVVVSTVRAGVHVAGISIRSVHRTAGPII